MSSKALVLDANILVRAVPEAVYAEAEEHLSALVAKRTIIAQALTNITNSGKKALIYTNETAWNKVTRGAICSQVNGQAVCAAGSPGQVPAYPYGSLLHTIGFWTLPAISTAATESQA